MISSRVGHVMSVAEAGDRLSVNRLQSQLLDVASTCQRRVMMDISCRVILPADSLIVSSAS